MTTVYSGILDTVLAFLPWKIILGATINKKERIGALLAMSMGVLYASPSHPPLMICASDKLSCYSSGIMSFLKIPALSDISDSGCKFLCFPI